MDRRLNRVVLTALSFGVFGIGMNAKGAHDHVESVSVKADPALREVVVTTSPIDIAPATAYSHHAGEVHLPFQWPVGQWLRGYRIDIVDANGALLSRDLLHHAGVMNLERRELAYPLVHRLLAAGRETQPIMLPESMAVPLAQGQKLLLYFALTNPAATPVKGAIVRVTLTWSKESTRRATAVLPVYFDANPKAVGGTRSFDVRPGRTATSAEFTVPASGYLRGLGAHLHDHAVEIRLEDALTAKVLARLKTKRQADGRLVSVDSTRFLLKRRGLHLEAHHRYRVVAIYDNPTKDVIREGAMAFMVGAFVPDAQASWPAIDPTDQQYKQDLSELLGKDPHAAHRHGGGF